MPELGQHMYAAHLDFSGSGIFIFVNHVLADAQVHQLTNLRVFPRGAKGG